MPPIPIYKHSPINAPRADGVTPKTAEKGQSQVDLSPPPTTTQDSPRYPPAQPGAAPAVPAPTGAASVQHRYSPPQPTPTQPLGSHGPPPPQPAAFPVPPGSSTTGPPRATSTGLPPPPKAGEATTQRGQGSTAYYPPQMSIPAPASAATQGAQRGTAAFAAAPSPLEHPPGYQQNPNAGELNRYQALEREEEERRRAAGGAAGGDEEGGVWGSVKGAMAAAGEKIAAAEEEVWKRINKDL